jgi:hypothetical protein
VGCVKTVAAERSLRYSCPDGYVGDGPVCTKTVIDEEPAEAVRTVSCPAGYSPSLFGCVRTVPAERSLRYSCPDGYAGNGPTCVKTVIDEEPAEAVRTVSCPAGYSPSLFGCVRTVPAERSLRYWCPKGYRGNGPTCIKTTTVTTGAVPSCPSGYSFVWTVCAKHITRNRLKSYSCPAGKRLATFFGTKVCVGRPNSAPAVTYSCPSGFTDVGSSCVKTLTQPATLVCPAGYGLSGATCSKTTTTTTRSTTRVTYSCPSGRLSGTNCVLTASAVTTTEHRCRAGWSLNGSTCTKTTTSTTRSTTTITYSCPSGRLSGTNCIITVPPTTAPPDDTTTTAPPDDTTTTAPPDDTTTTTTAPPDDTTTTAPPDDTTTTTTAPRCADGEHAHNPETGGGVHPAGVLATQAHRDTHGGGSAPTGCHGDHAPLERVHIDGLAGGSRTGPGTMTATFTVTPADASCRALLLGITANRASISSSTGAVRTVTVTAATLGEIRVYVYCTHQRLRRSIEPAVFTVHDPSCSQAITIGAQAVPQTGRWTTACTASQRGNDQTPYYAQRYTFTLDAAATVTVDLESSDTDAYLILLAGHGTGRTVLARNDNAASDTRNARLSADLAAGDYTIEATTSRARTTGNYTLAATAATAPAKSECTTDLGVLRLDPVISRGVWSASSGCVSSRRGSTDSPHYARYYTFTLESYSNVTVDLESSRNTYLYLLSGHGTGGRVRAQDGDADDATPNTHVSLDLSAGAYTIEATTFAPEAEGDFTLIAVDPPLPNPVVGELFSLRYRLVGR